MFALLGWEVPGALAEIKKLNLGPHDGVIMMQLRATYIIQMFLSVTNGTARNMNTIYDSLKSKKVLKQLADMDGCLLSLEALSSGWLAAFTDLLLHGSFDVATVLRSISIRPATDLAKNLLGPCCAVAASASGTGSSSTAAESLDESKEAMFTWKQLLEFGSTTFIPPAEKVLEVQLDLQLQLLKFANKTEAPWNDKLVVHCAAPDAESTGAKSKSTSYELLLHVTDLEKLIRSPKDDKLLMYKLPADLKLVFWGTVRILVSLWVGCAFVCAM